MEAGDSSVPLSLLNYSKTVFNLIVRFISFVVLIQMAIEKSFLLFQTDCTKNGSNRIVWRDSDFTVNWGS